MSERPNRNRVCSRACGTHEICCSGSRVRISGDAVKVLTPPVVKRCPLHESLYGVKEVNTLTVRSSVERKIAEFGFCCRNRRFDSDPIVAYGASEMMSVWLSKGLIDSAVVVCEGAGTVITSNGALVQGIGARLTGIVKTSPVHEIIQHVQKNGGVVLDEATARIDQAEGVKKAFRMGSKCVAVSVASFQAKAITKIRQLEKTENAEVIVFSVCNTLATLADVKYIAQADIACASASTILRGKIGTQALLQVGLTIPVYALSRRGKELILAYLAAFEDKLVVFRTTRLPYFAAGRGPTLKDSMSPRPSPTTTDTT